MDEFMNQSLIRCSKRGSVATSKGISQVTIARPKRGASPPRAAVASTGLSTRSMIDPLVNVYSHHFLVGGLVAIFYVPRNIGNLIIPIDELIFFRGVAQPPTSFNYAKSTIA